MRDELSYLHINPDGQLIAVVPVTDTESNVFEISGLERVFPFLPFFLFEDVK
jgi:hypothetical protein